MHPMQGMGRVGLATAVTLPPTLLSFLVALLILHLTWFGERPDALASGLGWTIADAFAEITVLFAIVDFTPRSAEPSPQQVVQILNTSSLEGSPCRRPGCDASSGDEAAQPVRASRRCGRCGWRRCGCVRRPC
jgi:hypothetical protein